MLDRINSDLTLLEQNVTKAEEELGYNDTKFTGFFKPFLKKFGKAEAKTCDSIEDNVPTYQLIDIFKTSDYFENIDGKLA